MTGSRILLCVAGSLIAAFASSSAARIPSAIGNTEKALVDQMRCERGPNSSLAINAMLKNRLIRYVADESGVYLFVPTVPLKFLRLPVRYMSAASDEAAFSGVPSSKMVGTAPPNFLEIDVAATKGELKKRALNAGLAEVLPDQGKRGFEVDSLGLYLAGKNTSTISAIVCADR